MFTKLKQHIAERKHKRVIATLRSELLFWGYNTSDMSDKELEKAVVRSQHDLYNAGFSAKHVNALASFGRIMNEAGLKKKQ